MAAEVGGRGRSHAACGWAWVWASDCRPQVRAVVVVAGVQVRVVVVVVGVLVVVVVAVVVAALLVPITAVLNLVGISACVPRTKGDVCNQDCTVSGLVAAAAA